MTAANPTEQVRSELKALKITPKMVSVRATANGMNIVIKSRKVFAAVNAAASKHSRIDRCHASGEILNGCNYYVSVEFDRSLVAEMTTEVAAHFAKGYALDWQGFYIAKDNSGGHGYTVTAWGPQGLVAAGHTRDDVMQSIAVAALKAGL
jgi:hypothetical protein